MTFWPGTTIVKSQSNAFTAHLNRAKPVEQGPYRACKCCGEDKPVSAFYLVNKSTCRACVIARTNTARAPHGGAYMRAVA